MFGAKNKGKLKGFVKKIAGKVQNFKDKHPGLASVGGIIASKLPGGNVAKVLKAVGKVKDKLGSGKLAGLAQKLKEGRLNREELENEVRMAVGDDEYDPSVVDRVEEELSDMESGSNNKTRGGMFGGKKNPLKIWWDKRSKTEKIIIGVVGGLLIIIILGFTVFAKKVGKKRKFFGKFRK